MKELVEVIAKALVDNPEEVVVTESMKGEDTLIAVSYTHLDVYKRQIQNYVENVDKTFVFANPNKKSISIQEFERERFVELMQDEEDRNEFADT